MTAYCTIADLDRRLTRGVLLDMVRGIGDGTWANADVQAALQAACDEATATIHTYLSGVAALPLSPVPDGFATLALDIACYYVARTRGVNLENSADKVLVDDYDRALARLKMYAKRELELPAANQKTGPSTLAGESASGVVMQSSPQRFTRNTLGGL